MIKSLSTILQTAEANPPRLADIIKTGIPTLDKYYIGIAPKELWMVGAYTGSGKTYYLLNLALEAAKQNKQTVYFSLEMPSAVLGFRIWGILCGVDPLHLEFTELLTTEERAKSEAVRPELEKLSQQIFFIDTAYTFAAIKANFLDLERLGKTPKLLMLDYIQNLQGFGNEYTRLGDAIIELQKFSKEKNIAMVMASQIANESQRVGVDDKVIGLKGNGALVAAPDFVLWIERPVDYTRSKQALLSLYVRKTRRNSLSKIPLVMQFPGGKVYEGEKYDL